MKRMSFLIAACFALSAAVTPVQAAGDAAAGKTKAATCAACHGANGEGKDKNPPLAGKPEAQLVQALQDYKTGKRQNGIMKTFTSKLSDSDMADVAAYYASLKGK